MSLRMFPLITALALTAIAPAALAKPADPIKEVEKAAGHKVVLGPKIRFHTTKGDFTVVLFPKEAPKTVDNFVKLTKKGFYNGLVFHRVIPGFVAQGGDPQGTGEGGPGYTIPDELHSTLKHLRGSLAMAKTSQPNSAGSQFYLCFDKIPHLDGKYTVFGQVIKGMDVVDKLQPTEGPNAGKPDKMISVKAVK
jgi:peptidylprolyl isomerase/peptidyl-prolyl cis-trans isomerase B (cyclophilin B)